jgi:hypothetical protein
MRDDYLFIRMGRRAVQGRQNLESKPSIRAPQGVSGPATTGYAPNCSRFPEFLNLWEQRDELRDDLFGRIDFGKRKESLET